MRRNSLKMAKILAVESAEDKVDFLFLVTDVAKRCKVRTEVLNRDDTTWWVNTNWLFVWTISYKRCVWFSTEVVKDLSVTEK